MSFVVKNTTISRLLDLVCPHICRSCGRLGKVLCDCCKDDNIRQHENICPLCKKCLGSQELKCNECETEFEMVVVAGWKEAALGKIVAEYKYKSVRAAGEVMAELLNYAIEEKIGELDDWEDTVIIPLPTISRHIRERGFDHTWDLAEKLAQRRGWKVEKLLERAKDTVQVGMSAAIRQAQAKEAYQVCGKIVPGQRYMLIDDVWTTGASVMGAARAMRKAGAEKLAVGVVVTTKARED